jgi:hypothetical protein
VKNVKNTRFTASANAATAGIPSSFINQLCCIFSRVFGRPVYALPNAFAVFCTSVDLCNLYITIRAIGCAKKHSTAKEMATLRGHL